MPADLRIVRRRTSRLATARAERSTSSLDCAHADSSAASTASSATQLVAPPRLEHEEVDPVEDALRTRDHGVRRRSRPVSGLDHTRLGGERAGALEQRRERDLERLRVASTERGAPLGVVESLVQGAQHRQPILQSGQLRRIDARLEGERRCRGSGARRGP